MTSERLGYVVDIAINIELYCVKLYKVEIYETVENNPFVHKLT